MIKEERWFVLIYEELGINKYSGDPYNGWTSMNDEGYTSLIKAEKVYDYCLKYNIDLGVAPKIVYEV